MGEPTFTVNPPSPPEVAAQARARYVHDAEFHARVHVALGTTIASLVHGGHYVTIREERILKQAICIAMLTAELPVVGP